MASRWRRWVALVVFGGVLGAIGCSARTSDPVRVDASAGIDAGGLDASSLDAAARDATADAAADANVDASNDAAVDAMVDAASDAGVSVDAGATPDGGECVPGSARACTLMCSGGETTAGLEVCDAEGRYRACALGVERCDGEDDDADGTIDEGCAPSGACVWIPSSCQAEKTIAELCAGYGMRAVRGKRCAVAGGESVMFEPGYDAFPLCCCDAASGCTPSCTRPECASCVVWEAIECCPM